VNCYTGMSDSVKPARAAEPVWTALGVVNILTMSVLEQTQEIVMLRSLGMTRRQVGKMILAEAGMMGLIGGAFGLVFGLSCHAFS
jgi:ABC-type antimicrobial peptide transport system permease subunit